MVRTLLIRGMLAGVIAGLLMFCFGRLVGERQIDRAIAFETQKQGRPAVGHSHTHGASTPAAHAHADEAEAELVSRSVQAGLGLFTAVVIYGAALGGLFALVFAYAHGRAADLEPRALSLLLAGAGLVAVYLVPSLKFPASPPAVSDPATIGYRTALYFIMIAISVAAMVGAAVLRRRLVVRHGGWSAALLAAAAYLVVILVALLALPDADTVPEHFPAALLWDFRLTAHGMQLVLWSAIGLVFGVLAEHALRERATGGRLRQPSLAQGA